MQTNLWSSFLGQDEFPNEFLKKGGKGVQTHCPQMRTAFPQGDIREGCVLSGG